MTAANEAARAPALPPPKNVRDVTTPEGVPLRFELATRSDRATALIIDLTIIFGVIIGLGLLMLLLASVIGLSAWQAAFGLIAFFILRNFYFTFFELRWHGTTPGKRVLRMRVIDRYGGRLRPESIFARNLMREVELFLPLTLVISANSVGAGDWSVILALIWAGIFTLMPLFNKDHMRAGDIVGGTWVIKAPKTRLLPDMAGAAAAAPKQAEAEAARYTFTREQLQIYGIYELQTLEVVLRQEGATAKETRAEVCNRIRRKIGWQEEEAVDPQRFLEAFYAALRQHLENRMLFGERRESKHDRKE
jgi:uncharacterized RDD family membrane protein YckC